MLPVVTVCASLQFKLQLYFANVFLGFLVPVLNKGGNFLGADSLSCTAL